MEEDLKRRVKEEEFTVKKAIGEGSFGKVEKCVRKYDEKIVAVKTI